MGAERDREFFALDDADMRGRASGRKDTLLTTAGDLGVDSEILDGLGSEPNIASRAERLSAIAASVGSMLAEAENELAVLRHPMPSSVADFLMAGQLNTEPEEDNIWYLGSFVHYRFAIGDHGEALVETEVRGGGMSGPVSFEATLPLTADWVAELLTVKGVERDASFCEQVASGIATQLVAPAEVQHG